MSRAFLYLVVKKCMPKLQPVYMVHRINPSRLVFSNKDDQPLQAAEAAVINAGLPRPTLGFHQSVFNSWTMDFALFGRNKDKIVAMDDRGSTVLYDDALRSVSPLPSMKKPKDEPLSFAVGDNLFVMSNPPFGHAPNQSVEALIDKMHLASPPQPEMVWHPILPPPYAKHEYDPDFMEEGYVQAYTMVDESQLWVSSKTYGTYSFDWQKNIDCNFDGHVISLGEWSKVGDWVLPFYGPAMYAKELDLCFGLSIREDLEQILGAVDLQPGTDQPPVVAHEWDTFKVPKGYYDSPDRRFIVHLGAGG